MLAGRGIATGALEVSLDDADTVIEGGPHLRCYRALSYRYLLTPKTNGVPHFSRFFARSGPRCSLPVFVGVPIAMR